MNIPYLSGVLLLALFLSSCTGLTEKEIAEIKQPVRVTERVSDYSEALDKFSALLKVYGEPDEPLFLLGKSIVNKTACGSLPMDVTQMMATAVNKIGGNIRYISYNPTYTEIERAHLGFPANRVVPTLVFDGAITECDENIDTINKEINATAVGSYKSNEGEVGGSYSKTFNLSRLALDMHLMEYSTGMPLPRIQSSLAVNIKNARGGYQFAIQVVGSGFGLNNTHKITQGKHDAIRALVNLSVLQVLGKYLMVPYWRCLPGAPPDKEVIRALENNFSRAEPAQAIAAIQFNLQKYGKYVQITGVMDTATRNAVADIVARSNGRAPSVIGPALYSYLYLNQPVNSWEPDFISPELSATQQTQNILREQELAQIQQRLEQYIIQQSQPQATQNNASAQPVQESAEAPPKAPPAPPKPKHVQPLLGLQTAVIYRPGKLGETVLISGGKLTSGEKYKIVVEPEQDCYLYVFQRDSEGRLFPIFPRADRQDDLTNPVQGKVTYEFPGNGRYFFLDQRKGREHIYFYSTAKADQRIEQAISVLNNKTIPDQKKQAEERKLMSYISSKETITAARPGKQYPLQGTGGMQVGQMNNVQALDKNKLYIFTLNHE